VVALQEIVPLRREERNITMGIAISLEQYLDGQGIAYDALKHDRTECAAESAAVGNIPSDSMAKAVVLSCRDGHVLAVVPASRQVQLEKVCLCIEQPVSLATETELTSLFPDCEAGAVPPIGAAYGLRTVVDDSLEAQKDIYFEAGDHRTLVHVRGDEFHRLMRTVSHGRICAENAKWTDDTSYWGA
jgi:Ala-tRNA(Pro) deacylase